MSQGWTIIVIVKSLRVLGEVKMMTLNDIYKTNEIDGIPVTLLGIENLVATFQDIDGNEIEIQVDCRIESVPKNKRSRLHFPIA